MQPKAKLFGCIVITPILNYFAHNFVKVNNIYAFHCAYLAALSASGALIVINLCTEICDCNSSAFAGLDAPHTAYAARHTFASGERTLILVCTQNGGFDLI